MSVLQARRTRLAFLHRVAVPTRAACLASLLVSTIACTPAATSPAPDHDGGVSSFDLELSGLDGEVEVVIDDRGIPHIYATTEHDVFVAQGYLMSRDRFAQMELLRRRALGRLAEVGGPELVADDTAARWAGHRRMGEAIFASLAPDDPSRRSAEAFVEGVNLYLDAVHRGEEHPAVRGAEIVHLVLANRAAARWAPADVFALARFQAASMSFYPHADLQRSARLAAVLEAFPVDHPDGRIAARSGLHEDLFTQRPARAAFTRDGFPGDGTHDALEAPRPTATSRFLADSRAIAGALPFLRRLDAASEQIFGDAVTRGSNVWAVSGRHTASGAPILADDPHLALISPAVFWHVHLDTERMGGDRPMSVEGTAFVGLPGVIVGFNRTFAWGLAATGDDVTDAYQEQIVGACDEQGNVIEGSVLHQGGSSPIAFREETIAVAGAAPVVVRFPYASHRPASQLVPGSCVPVEGEPGRFVAVSVRYTGWEPSDELSSFLALMTATNVEEGRAALDAFQVGSQNFMMIDRDEIFWSTRARMPVRDPRARTLRIENGIPAGSCPHMVLSGMGEHEWVGDLDPAVIPHERNPEAGWISTANQDNVGVTADGNPCNDAHYVGTADDFGWRQARIQERLRELVARGGIDVEDMTALQADTQSPLGRTMRDRFVAILGDEGAMDALGLSAREREALADVRRRLADWTLETPHGVGATDERTIADSIATTLFNAALTRIAPLALADELERLGVEAPTSGVARLLEWMIASPSRLHTYDADVGASVLWDDLRTEAVEDEATIVIRGALAGVAFLETRLGPDRDAWRWGRLHTVRFSSVVPALTGRDVLSIPPPDSAEHPDGFPRHGDWGNVDPGNFREGLWNNTSFSFGSGASQRLVVEMTPEGPRAFNALPGGQSIDPDSPHHADEAMLWIRNEAPPLYFDHADVQAHAARVLRIGPAR